MIITAGNLSESKNALELAKTHGIALRLLVFEVLGELLGDSEFVL